MSGFVLVDKCRPFSGAQLWRCWECGLERDTPTDVHRCKGRTRRMTLAEYVGRRGMLKHRIENGAGHVFEVGTIVTVIAQAPRIGLRVEDRDGNTVRNVYGGDLDLVDRPGQEGSA